MLRVFFYVLFGLLLAAFVKRFLLRAGRPRPARGAGQAGRGMPSRVVCGGCGHEYDPEAAGWLCPKCGK